MLWFFAILLVLVMGGIAVVAAGRGRPMTEVYDDRPDVLLGSELVRGSAGTGDVDAIRPQDLRRVRFSLAFRGYRMSEVDALLDRLATQLEATGPAAAGTGTSSLPEDEPRSTSEGRGDDGTV